MTSSVLAKHLMTQSIVQPLCDSWASCSDVALSVRCAAVLETGPLPPQQHKSWTVCSPVSDYVGCHTASSGSYWTHFYSDSEATAQWELFLTAPNRNILTYLLTYFGLWFYFTNSLSATS